MTFERPKAGQWVQPIRKGYKLACCDCGLVHRMDFRVYKGHAQFRAYRAERSTAQMRRHKKAGKPCGRFNWWNQAVLLGVEHCMTCGYLRREHPAPPKKQKTVAAQQEPR